MNVAAFAVVIARERVSEHGDDIALAREPRPRNPWLAWPMTIAMLSLAGFPATAGFIGKFFLIDAAVDGDYTWLGIAIVVGSILSLGYYLRVVAAVWMGRYEIEMPSLPAAPRQAGLGLVPRGRHPRPARGGARGDRRRGADDLLRPLAGSAVRRRPRRGARRCSAAELALGSPEASSEEGER